MRKLFLILVFLAALSPFCIFAQTTAKVLTIEEDIINPVTASYVARALEAAEKDDSIVIIKMDTPGGLLASTEKIVKLLLNSPVPVITYIYPKGARAASAGVFIGYASHILAMSPSTHIGAAHPIISDGKWGDLDEETKKKILNDTLAWAENIARQRNRQVGFVKDAVENSISITEEEAIKEVSEIEEVTKKGKKRKQHIKRKVCDLIAQDINELLEKINGKTVTTSKGEKTISTDKISLEEINFTPREKFLNVLINPNIAYMLMTLGFLGLIFEVTHPGFGFPGIAGIICLILAFYAFSVLPVNYAGVALIVLGLIFFVVEAFTPTFGMFTLGGIISFLLGSIMLFNQPETIRVSYEFIIPTAIIFGLTSVFVLTKIIQIHRKPPPSGKEGLIGKEGTAYSDISNNGKVFIHGEIWNAVSEEEIKKDEPVQIIEVKGLTLVVKRKEGENVS